MAYAYGVVGTVGQREPDVGAPVGHHREVLHAGGGRQHPHAQPAAPQLLGEPVAERPVRPASEPRRQPQFGLPVAAARTPGGGQGGDPRQPGERAAGYRHEFTVLGVTEWTL